MKIVSSKIKLNSVKITQLRKATAVALEETIDALHTEVAKAEVIPFGEDKFDKNGKKIYTGGTLSGVGTQPDYFQSKMGRVRIVSSTPYARRMYFHPEYNFYKGEHRNARGNWYEPWLNGKHKNFCKNAFAKFYKKEAGLK